MNEEILKIEEVDFDDRAGFEITTDKQSIKLLIDAWQCCCESWGYFMTEDDLDKFIGAKLVDIRITDSLNKPIDLEKTTIDKWLVNSDGTISVYDGDIMFVDLITDRGVLQFVAYNEHNGYYGHQAVVISEQLKYNKYL